MGTVKRSLLFESATLQQSFSSAFLSLFFFYQVVSVKFKVGMELAGCWKDTNKRMTKAIDAVNTGG